MKCLVCLVTFPEASGLGCPQCGYDHAAADARDPAKVQAARNRFRDKTTEYAPDKRLTRLDKLFPWVALVIGFVIFAFWARACGSFGLRLS